MDILEKREDGSVTVTLSLKELNVIGAGVWMAKEDTESGFNRFFPEAHNYGDDELGGDVDEYEIERQAVPLTRREFGDLCYDLASDLRKADVDMG
jgi:hypothetical protein